MLLIWHLVALAVPENITSRCTMQPSNRTVATIGPIPGIRRASAKRDVPAMETPGSSSGIRTFVFASLIPRRPQADVPAPAGAVAVKAAGAE
ncbi:hypothetical protein [Streptomyces sp. NPDC000618]|uniref:hypothetical protein n=1 Tax=Streptomyces sp. NPDC000618 TaxID=3154265 RepID=UPI00332A7A4F